jgi:hypothetical protein
MAQLTYREAIARGIAQEMRRDESVVFLGEDIGAAGGVFKGTVGLLEEFGKVRVRDTPISEQAIIGAAMGASMTGLRPVAEIMFADFFAVCWDIVANEIAKSRYMTNGQVTFPLVIRSGNGGGLRFGAQHSQSVENWAMMIPGLKVVVPSNAVRRHRSHGRVDPRRRSGHLPRGQGPLRVQDGGARRGDRGHPGFGQGPASRRATRRSSRWATWCPGPSTPPRSGSGRRASDCAVVDVRSLVPLDTTTLLREDRARPGDCSPSRRTLGCAGGARSWRPS